MMIFSFTRRLAPAARTETELPRAQRNEAAAGLEKYRLLIERKAYEVRLGLSARRAFEFVRRPEEPLDFGDWCQKSHEEWLFVNQNRMEMMLLRELEGALRRIGSGGFGVCQDCAEPIASKRLDAVPWARLCVACEEKAGRDRSSP